MTDPPKIDAPQATLYRTAISLGTAEIQLIWTRYTGFIVMNGFLVNAIAQQWTRNATEQAASINAPSLALVGGLGLLLNSAWHILNFSGWQNQNLFYYQANQLLGQPIGLLTDQFDRHRAPYGWIYWTAQFIPMTLSVGASACIGLASTKALGFDWCVATVESALLWLGFAAFVLVVEYRFIHGWTRKRSGKGEAV